VTGEDTSCVLDIIWTGRRPRPSLLLSETKVRREAPWYMLRNLWFTEAQFIVTTTSVAVK
jgi:hypothetical protein